MGLKLNVLHLIVFLSSLFVFLGLPMALTLKPSAWLDADHTYASYIVGIPQGKSDKHDKKVLHASNGKLILLRSREVDGVVYHQYFGRIHKDDLRATLTALSEAAQDGDQ